MDTLIGNRKRSVGSSVEEHLNVEAPDSPDGSLEIDLTYFDSTESASEPIARSFVTLPWEVAKEIAYQVVARDKELSTS